MSQPTSAPLVPTPSSSGTPIVTDALRLVRVLFSPGAVFGEIQERPTFWVPWALISVVTAVISFMMRPFNNRLAQMMTEHAGRPWTEPSAARAAIGAVLAPLGVLIFAAIAGGILYLLVSVTGGQTTYKRMLTVVIFAWPIVVIQQAVQFVVLTMRGVGSINGPQDLIVSLGADLLVPSDAPLGYFMRFVLMGIGPLQVWSLTIVAVGLMVLAKSSKGQAWTAAVLYFVVVLLCTAGLGAFGMSMAAKAAGN